MPIAWVGALEGKGTKKEFDNIVFKNCELGFDLAIRSIVFNTQVTLKQ